MAAQYRAFPVPHKKCARAGIHTSQANKQALAYSARPTASRASAGVS